YLNGFLKHRASHVVSQYTYTLLLYAYLIDQMSADERKFVLDELAADRPGLGNYGLFAKPTEKLTEHWAALLSLFATLMIAFSLDQQEMEQLKGHISDHINDLVIWTN